ncbi:MAG: hypothetical protein L0229_07810 [Blastocatellia bacterium]|nr:hypothetical protein [Blastocatellia bacterium]
MHKRILLIALLVALVGCGSAQQSAVNPAARSYELYSWQLEGKWVYMIFDMSIRPRLYSDIVKNRATRIGIKAIEYHLRSLPKGSEIIWRKGAPEGMEVPVEEQKLVLMIPPKKQVRKMKAVCDRLGLKLRME